MLIYGCHKSAYGDILLFLLDHLPAVVAQFWGQINDFPNLFYTIIITTSKTIIMLINL